jgi:hypothetical protein
VVERREALAGESARRRLPGEAERAYRRPVLQSASRALLMNMNRSVLLLVSLVLSAGAGPVFADALAERLAGTWSCVSGPCPDQRIEFAGSAEAPMYNAWRNARPVVSGARWALRGDRLYIACCAAVGSDWVVVRADAEELVLLDEYSARLATLRRAAASGD